MLVFTPYFSDPLGSKQMIPPREDWAAHLRMFQQWSQWTRPLSNLVGKILSTQNATGRQPKRKREQEHLFVQLKTWAWHLVSD